jgi:hypothetical protein
MRAAAAIRRRKVGKGVEVGSGNRTQQLTSKLRDVPRDWSQHIVHYPMTSHRELDRQDPFRGLTEVSVQIRAQRDNL